MSSQLLCTFTTQDEHLNIVEKIKNTYEILFDKIFILQNIDKLEELYCTYNIDSHNSINAIEKTILLHRKKETNSLYTINALNKLVLELNNGVKNSEFKIPWNNYRNCLLLINNNDFIKVNTKIFKIISLT